jgi:DMSO/TMAO reductase YedYZ molybdopterin-dependent catalytic subunit
MEKMDDATRPSDRVGPAIAATAAALAVLWVFSMLLNGAPFAPSAVGDLLLRATPGDVATFFIEALGPWARRLLALGTLAGALVLGGVAGTRLRLEHAAGVLAAAAAGAAAFSPSEEPRPVAVAVAVVAAAAAYVIVGRAAARRAEVAGDDGAPDAGRRRAIAFGLGASAAIATGGGALGWIVSRLAGPDTDVDLVAPADPARIVPSDDFPRIPGLTPEVTSAEAHYVVDINLVQPAVEADGWKLAVTGEVERPLEFSFDELQRRFEVVEEFITLACVSNEVGGDLVGNSAWGGVRLADVLEAAGAGGSSHDVVLRGADGYSDSIPMDVARDPAVLLAVSQNGAPLTREHGFPCRVRIPNIYGMKNVKWLEAIEVVAGDHQGYWQERGWSDEAVVRTQSRIDVAGDDHAARRGEPTWIAGIAWAGDRGISKVEVSTDAGATWSGARVKPPASRWAWSLWAYRWTPDKAGTAEVWCRATDGDGNVQSATPAPPHPNGAAGLHTVAVDVT